MNNHIDQTIQIDKGELIKMTTYDEYLRKAKQLNYSMEKYVHLEEIIAISKKAKLPLTSPLQIMDRIEFGISLAAAVALYDSYTANGNVGYIIYLNQEGQLICHYADSRIEIIEERT